MTVRELSLINFESTIGAGGIVIVDAGASWCGPCRTFAPVFEAVARRHPDLTWVTLDTEREDELAHGLGVRALPTVLVFRDGFLLHQQAGMMRAAALEQLVTQARALDMRAYRAKLRAAHA